MHVISERKLREFWAIHPDAEAPLKAWIKVATEAEWEKVADVKDTYAHASQVGKFTVFNVGGNKYRLVTVIHFNRGKLFIRHMLTHEEYDREGWKED